jgi:putative PIN family toxin of toxin-antitoxin system
VRIALDTNVIVSALATRGLCADLLVAVLVEHELVLGETDLAEVPRVLRDKLGVSVETAAEIEAYLRSQAQVVSGPAALPADGPLPAALTIETTAGLDEPDAAVLAEAVAAAADVLVTGDAELLAVPQSPVRIVSPRGLWDLLRQPH